VINPPKFVYSYISNPHLSTFQLSYLLTTYRLLLTAYYLLVNA